MKFTADMTEKEKMLAGLEYSAVDKDLLDELNAVKERLLETNLEQTVGYGEDHYCAAAHEAIRKSVGRDSRFFDKCHLTAVQGSCL